MSQQEFRLSSGNILDRSKAIQFSFNGRTYSGYRGDTLASALLANGVHFVARSFKYHRPRGIVTCGPEEPSALVTIGDGGRTEPNLPATTAEIFEGMSAQSQNHWPSLSFDVLSVNSFLKPLLPAGFYYKTFMWPRLFWKKMYEPMIRRSAGLGRLEAQPDPDHYDARYAHCDILIVGTGPAGLVAAREAAKTGAKIILADHQPFVGGHLIGEDCKIEEQSCASWAKNIAQELSRMPNVRILLRTNVFGRYDGMTFGAIETTDIEPKDGYAPRQRFWTICTKELINAAGAIERPLIFPGNDLPGVMLASAARKYIRGYGVLPGRRAIVFTNNDEAYATVHALHNAGAIVTVVDTRSEGAVAGSRLAPIGIPIHYRSCISKASGRHRVSKALIASLDASNRQSLAVQCDLVCMSGGWNPTIHLLTHCGGKPSWDENSASFKMHLLDPTIRTVGGAAGQFDLTANLTAAATQENDDQITDVSEIEPSSSYNIEPFWMVPDDLCDNRYSFVDFQTDVTVADLKLAHREGFDMPELAKRYTALGMATDQGKLSNVNAIGILSEISGLSIPEVGTTTFRPLASPVALGALAGHRRGMHFRPHRRTPIHDWHRDHGAIFAQSGLWERPNYYLFEGEDTSSAINREVITVRSRVGAVDVSTLGKIEIDGKDAGAFLDHIYMNAISRLPVGKARYGVMLREDGMVFDDGTVTRMSENHFFLTTTTENAAHVMQHLEYCHQIHWPDLELRFATVTESWAAFAVAGPNSRRVLAAVLKKIDLSNKAFPPMSFAQATAAGATIRVMRISYSGELAYEIFVPTNHALDVWNEIFDAGEAFGITAFGLEAMRVMRTEKGHVAGSEIDGRMTATDLGLGRMVSKSKDAVYVGAGLTERECLRTNDRYQLVGLRSLDAHGGFRTGAHLVNQLKALAVGSSQGHVTSSVYSPEIGCCVALAFLKNGRQRFGERVYAVSPLHGEISQVEITEPVFIDPAGTRSNA